MSNFKEITEDLIYKITESRKFKDLKLCMNQQNNLSKKISFDFYFLGYAEKYKDNESLKNIKYLFQELIENAFISLFSEEKYGLYNLNFKFQPDEYHHIEHFEFEIPNNDNDIYLRFEEVILFLNLKIREDLFNNILEQINKPYDKRFSEDFFNFIKDLSNQKNNIDYDDEIKKLIISKLKTQFGEEQFNILIRSDAFSLTKLNFNQNNSKCNEDKYVIIKVPNDGISTLESVCKKIKMFNFIEDVIIVDKKINLINIKTNDHIKSLIKKIETESCNEFFLTLIKNKNKIGQKNTTKIKP